MSKVLCKVISLFLSFLICISAIPTLPVEAVQYYSEAALSNINCSIISNSQKANYVNNMMKYHILSSTDNFRVARNLQNGSSVVFFFDGCSDNVDDPTYGNYNKYHLSAYCAVVQEVNGSLKIVYESENCSTIPDNPRNASLNGGDAVPTVLDGVYNIYSINHLGRYAALHIANSSGTVPAIRCSWSSSYVDSSAAINIHARSGFSNAPSNGISQSSYSSTGCFNVGLITDGWNEYNKFISATLGISNAVITTPYSNGSWTKCTEWIDKGVVIVDRSQYKAQLEQIYGGDSHFSASTLVRKITEYTDNLDIEIAPGEHTCNRGEYVFFEEAHPHYSCYQCSICGEIWADTTSSNYSDSCYTCNHLEKPILTTSNSTYTIGDNITISWNAINGNEYYWINVYRDDALIVDQTLEQRTSYTLENAQPGSYRILVSANNAAVNACSEPLTFEVKPQCADGHTWNAGTVTTEPTEETEGVRTYTCTVCGETRTESIAALPHITHRYVATVTPPTCTEQGYTVYFCRCGHGYTDDYVDPLGHTWGEGVVQLEPTEEEHGLMVYYCQICHDIKGEVIPQLPHTHDYTTSATPPTCTERGYTTYTCECGETYNDSYIDPLGHNWDSGVVTREPTEDTEGIKTYTCSRCNETRTESIATLPHTTHNYTAIVTPPTCTEQGFTTYTCGCGERYVDNQVEALGHSWNSGVITLQPTEDTEGLKTFTCQSCGATRTETIPVLVPEPTDPPVALPTLTGTYTTDLVMPAADLGVSAPDSVLRATLTFGEDGSASCTWEAVDLTAFRIFFHDMFVNAYYAMAYGAGITDLAEIERFCMESTGLSVSDYMDTLVTDQAMIESFTPASTSGTYSYNADHTAIFTDLAIMEVPSDPSVENSFVLGGNTLYLNAASWDKPDYTFVCTSR